MGGFALGFYYAIPHATIDSPQTMATSTITAVTIGTATVQVEVEDTDNSRSQGLSGRASLAEGSGMLFVFDSPGTYGFWMKEMNFAIDIIFIDASGVVVTIAKDASPSGYHQNPPQVFYPYLPVQYVLEVSAGFAAQHGVMVGQKVTFK